MQGSFRAGCLLAILLPVSAAWGQLDGPVAAALDITPTGRSAAEGVYVDDSSQALDRFTLAGRLADLGEWDKAAEVYHETIDTLGRRLVASRTDSEGRVVQYRPVADAVRSALEAWPDEGRQAYRDQFDGEARRALAAIRELDPDDPARRAGLTSIARRFPLTDAAGEAQIELIDRDLAAGRVGSAYRSARDATVPSSRSSQLPELLLRRVATAGLLGRTSDAESASQRLADDFPNATGTVAGEEQNLAQVARDLLDGRLAPRDVVAIVDGWPTFAGDPTRNVPAELSPGKLSPQFATMVVPDEAFPGGIRGIEQRLGTWRKTVQMAGMFPVLADGVLYWTDNVTLRALELASRQTPIAWTKTHPATQDRPAGVLVADVSALPTPRAAALAPVIDGNRIFAIVGRRDFNMDAVGGRSGTRGPSLISADRRDGRLLWRTNVSDFDRDDVEAALGLVTEGVQDARAGQADLVTGFLQGHFFGAPVHVGQTLWMLVQTSPQRQQAFSQSFAAGINAETGALEHIIYLMTVGEGRLRQQASRSEPEPDVLPSANDGVVYMPTGQGCIAAIESDEGRLLWLNLYERASLAERTTDSRLRRRFQAGGATVRESPPFTKSLPFHASTPIVADGRLYYRPPDARSIVIYDAADGELVAAIPDTPPSLSAIRPAGRTNFGSDNDAIRTVLHVDGDRLYGFGGRTIYSVRLGAAIDAVTSGTFARMSDVDWAYWISPFSQPAHRGGSRSESIMGRPAVTDAHLLVPLWDGIALLDKETGRRLDGQLGGLRSWESLPPDKAAATVPGGNPPRAFDNESLVGNLIASEDRVIVAGQQAIGVFADSDAVRRRLLAALDADPTDPEPLASLARLDYLEDNLSGFRQRLDEAAALAGGNDLAFETALSVIPTSSGLATAAALDAAEALADEPVEHVRARFAFHDARDAPGGDEARLAAVRDVLENPDWRALPFETGSLRGFTAGDVAASRLASMRGSVMPTLFDETDRRAREALDSAVGVEALVEVSAMYPTSPAGIEALLQAARTLEESGDAVAAAGMARRVLEAAVMGRDAQAGFEARLQLVQLDLLDGTKESLADAASRLEWLATQRPTRQVTLPLEPDGSMRPTLVEQAAAETRRRASVAARDAAADVSLPAAATSLLFDLDGVRSFEGLLTLLPTVHSAASGGVELAVSGSEVIAVGLDDGWTTDIGIEVTAARWIDGDAITFGPAGLVSVDGETGAVQWNLHEPADASAVSGDDVVRYRDGQLTSVTPDGTLRWSVATSAQDNIRLRASRDVVVVQSDRPEADNGWSLAIHDAATGRLLMSRAGPSGEVGSGEARKLIDALPLHGGRVAVVYDDRIALLDPATQTPLAGGVDVIIDETLTRLARLEQEARRNAAAAAGPFEAAAPGGRFDVWLGRPQFPRVVEAGGRLLVMADLRAASRRDGIAIDLATGDTLTVNDPARGQPVPVLLRGASAQTPFDLDDFPPDARDRARAAMANDVADERPKHPAGGSFLVEGRRVYTLGERGVEAYDLDAPGGDVGPHWTRPDDVYARALDPATAIGGVLGREHVFLIDRAEGTTTSRLVTFSRRLVPEKGYESGLPRGTIDLAAEPFNLRGDLTVRPIAGGLVLGDAFGRVIVLPAAE